MATAIRVQTDRREGEVKSWGDKGGWGFIESEGERFFFHVREALFPPAAIHRALSVTFEPYYDVPTGKTPLAIKVKTSR